MKKQLLGIAVLCLSQSALSQTAEEARISQMVRAEVKKQLDALRDERGTAPTIDSVSAALASQPLDDGWYAIPAGSAATARELSPALSSPSDLPPQSAGNMMIDRALAAENLRSPTDSLAGPAGVSTADNPVRQNSSAIELNASANGTQATITLGNKATETFEPKSRRIRKSAWSFTASAPVNKDTGEATFASLTGLANGFTLGVARTLTSVRGVSVGEPTGWSRVFNVGAKAGYDDFAYFTSLISKQTDRELRWSAGASFATTSPQRRVYFGAGFDVQRAYQSNRPRIVCPLSDDDTFDCVQGSFGPPQRGYQRIAHVEVRSALLARPFSLRLSHDFASDRTSADLPIYLLRNKESKFTGGLRLGWTSDNDFVAGVFVGKEFTIQ